MMYTVDGPEHLGSAISGLLLSLSMIFGRVIGDFDDKHSNETSSKWKTHHT